MLNPVRAFASLPVAVARSAASTVASAAEGAVGGGLAQARQVLGTPDRPRRVWSTRGRMHIELRPVDSDQFEALAARLRERLGSQRGVRWVEAVGAVGHVVVAFDEDATTPEELVDVVQDVEREQGADQEPFEAEAPDHPGDVAPILRGVAELSGDALGTMLSLVGRFTPIRALPAAVDPGLITSLLAWTPRLRRPIEERLGTTTTGVALALANGVSQGLSGSVLGPTLDMAHRSVLLNEAIARRRLWHELEPRLWAEPTGHTLLPPVTGERPQPVPPGPLERYAEAMWRGSLGAFAVSLAATRNLQRATAAVYAGLPKAARMGREAFAAQVGRVFAGRGVLTLNPRPLQLLDRVDCLVVHEELLVEGSFELGELLVLAGADADRARRRAWSLFDAGRPDRVRRNRGWTLGPLEALGLEVPPGQRRAAARLRRLAHAVLGLAHNGDLVAVVAIRPSLRPGAEELVAAARRAGLEVAIAGARDEAAPLEARRLPAGGPALTRAVRRLQRDGRVVAVVASGEAPALPAADLSLGLRMPDRPPPLGAHLLVADDDLAHAFLLVQACAAGRRASQQSVRLALAGAGVGGALTLTGPPATATRRVMTAVNLASTLSLGNGVRLATDLALQPPPPVRDRTPWHAMEVQAVLERLGSSAAGLDDEEARRRRLAPERPPSAPVLLGRSVLGEVVTPLTPILGAGAGLSAAFGSLTDAVMVSSVVGFNALLGGVQQFRADRAIAQLGGRHRGRVQVVRGGAERELDPEELVPGDVVRLQAGDLVPADCRILEAVAVEVDESSLTGESLPVAKSAAPSLAATVAERSSMLYEGSSVAAGRATAVVVATGPRTEARMGALLAATPTATSGVEARLSGLTSLSSPVALGSGLAVAGMGALRGLSLREVAGAGVSLTVAAVPEGLPLLATMAQLSAARRLSRLGALVRAPRAVEALGRVDLVCADKTGTLTEGRIRLRRVTDGLLDEPVEELSPRGRRVLAAGLRASPTGPLEQVPHPTDRALLQAGTDLEETETRGAPGWRRIAELPFEPSRGFHAVLGRSGGRLLLSVKGAPEEIVPQCTFRRQGEGEAVDPLDDGGRAELASHASQLARQGLRLLAVAESTRVTERSLDTAAVHDLTFLGFLGLSDPVRPAATSALAELRRAGIEVLMITGDHPSTAEGIAAELGLPNGETLTGAELDRLSDAELEAVLPATSVFARVTPTHKVRIVAALQRMGRVVAMTGDGANDAPAIRLADVGIAIGARSTQAARDAAALVVVHDRIETIVAAVLEGRALWASVREAVAILVGGNLGEIGFTLAGTALSGRSPLNARQLLLVNLLTDALPSVAIATRPPSTRSPEDLLREGPEASLGAALNRAIAWRAGVTAAGTSGAWLAARMTGTRAHADTVALVALVGTQLGQTIMLGWRDPVVLAAGLGSAAALAAMVQTPGVSRLVGCRPLGPLGWTQALTAAGLATTAAAVLPGLLTPRQSPAS